MKNILVSIDFSEVTDMLVEKAKELASTFGSTLWLVHVAAPDPDFVGFDAGPQIVRDQRAQNLRSEHQTLQTMAEELKNDFFKVTPLLIQGPTGETLLAQSKKIGADLIIIGSHGHGMLYNALVGSVCETMIRKSKIPLLVVPINK